MRSEENNGMAPQEDVPAPALNGGSANGVKAKDRSQQRYLGKGRKMRIGMVGAGITGIAAVKLFKDEFPGREVELVIYEKNDDVTGTWLENRYPGCACDVPAHAYNYTWEVNPRWSRAYVGAVELYTYYKGRAASYGVDEFVKLNRRVTAAAWSESQGKWLLEISDLVTGASFTDEVELLINGSGFLNNWRWPDIPNLRDFGGQLLHSASWDDSYDFKDKTVIVVGSGSSAIQIVPELQPVVKHMTSINRSKTWITPEFAAEFAPEGRASAFTEAQMTRWEENLDEYVAYRKGVETSMNQFFDMQIKGSEVQTSVFEQFTRTMKERLGHDEDLVKKLVPEFEVGCRRITPGHGYLEALASSNVAVSVDRIVKATAQGLQMADGTVIAADAIVCATGFDTSYRPNFPLVAFGKDLRDIWKDEPASYFSIAAPGMPNYFIMSGPNFPLANGCLVPCIENNIKYALAAARKLQYDGIQSLWPKQEAVDDFQEYKDYLMSELVWTGSCSSWYKNGKPDGKVWGPWCGSSLHYLETMARPRWEDYEIRYLDGNRYRFLGNGRTKLELVGGDLAYYVSPQRLAGKA